MSFQNLKVLIYGFLKSSVAPRRKDPSPLGQCLLCTRWERILQAENSFLASQNAKHEMDQGSICPCVPRTPGGAETSPWAAAALAWAAAQPEVAASVSLQHWDVFRTITEVFILVPALVGLKGNLEMTLASRLSTAVSVNRLVNFGRGVISRRHQEILHLYNHAVYERCPFLLTRN